MGGFASSFELWPHPRTRAEMVAVEMLREGAREAQSLGVALEDHLCSVLAWLHEPEGLAFRLAQSSGSGDMKAARVAGAMLRAGRKAETREGPLVAAIGKLEALSCPTCGRAFGDSA